jgi:general secretion pathway protein K
MWYKRQVQDRSITRSQAYGEAAQAMEIALGGEASAVAALRRDGREAPQIDHANEAWMAITDRETAIEGGTFALSITDAQGRFNIANLTAGGVQAMQTATRLAQTFRDDPELVLLLAPGKDETASTAVMAAARKGDIAGMVALAGAMTSDSRLLTDLPIPTDVNVNAAPEALLAILFGNAVTARRVVALRDRKGYVTRADLRGLGILLPPGLGFRSDFYEVQIDVMIGTTERRLESLLWRRREGDVVSVEAIRRRYAAVAD